MKRYCIYCDCRLTDRQSLTCAKCRDGRYASFKQKKKSNTDYGNHDYYEGFFDRAFDRVVEDTKQIIRDANKWFDNDMILRPPIPPTPPTPPTPPKKPQVRSKSKVEIKAQQQGETPKKVSETLNHSWSKVNAEDLASANRYFKEVELTASAIKYCLMTKVEKLSKEIEQFKKYNKKLTIGSVIVNFIAGGVGIIFGWPWGAIICIALITFVINYEKSGQISKHEKTITDLNEWIRKSSSVVSSAKSARMVSGFTMKYNDDLEDKINNIRYDLENIEKHTVISPVELDEARIICDLQVTSSDFDFLKSKHRIDYSAAEVEAQAEEEAIYSEKRKNESQV